VRALGWWAVALVIVQLTVAATMRHNYAGMAIPTFPWSNADGGLLPHAWDFRVSIHFVHRVMAVVLTVSIALFVRALWQDAATSALLRWLGVGLVAMLGVQILLGGYAVWSGRDAYITTAHVIVGALTLATTFLVTFFTYRHAMEAPRPYAA
jgi:cytochrome c oxidase assembly protein subunit 15